MSIPAGLVAALGLAATLQAAPAPSPPPPPAWWREALEQFGSACIERSVPAGAVEVGQDALPGALRRHYRRADTGRFHRLGGDRPNYLLEVTNPKHRVSSACAVAVPDRRRLAMLFGGLIQFGPHATAVFGVDYSFNATIVGDYVVVEIAHHAPRPGQ